MIELIRKMSFSGGIRRQFRRGIDSSESRRRRQDNLISLRRKKRDEVIHKRLKKNNWSGNGEEIDFVKLCDNLKNNVDVIPTCSTIMESLSCDDPPISQVLESGCHVYLVKLLESEDPDLIYAATECLTNISAGSRSHTQCLLDSGILPVMMCLLDHNQPRIIDQAIWTIGNIIADNNEWCFDIVNGYGLVTKLFKLLDVIFESDADDVLVSLLKNLTFVIYIISRSSVGTDLIPYLKYIIHLTSLVDYPSVVSDACWSIHYITNDTDDSIISDCVNVYDVHTSIVNVIVLNRSDMGIVKPSFKILSNLVSGTEDITAKLIDVGMISIIRELLSNEDYAIRQDCCFALSNIATDDIQSIIDGGLIPILRDMMKNDTLSVVKEICWVFSNITYTDESKYIDVIVKSSVLPVLCDKLGCEDIEMIRCILKTIADILKCNPSYTFYIEECGGLASIEAFRLHSNDLISRLSDVICDYFE